jgi:enoyl-CoA hydratase
MATATRADMESRDQFAQWNRIKAIRKPIVAAVSGFALGGGCELMMHCDVVVCSENAKIGQPEINIGVMPGAGGTQRLTRAVGKAVAMDIVLSGRFLSAKEAMIFGLVSRVVPKEHWFDEAMNVAQAIATKAPISLRHAKESVLNADEIPLNDALGRERELFYMLFDTEDQSEGMSAFLEKRRPSFTGK